MNVNEKILDKLLIRGEYLSSFTDQEVATLIPILEKANDELIGRIASSGGAWTREWLADVKTSLDEVYAAAVRQMEGVAAKDLRVLAEDEADFAKNEFEDAAMGVSFSTPSASTLYSTISAIPAAEGSTIGQLFEALGVSSSKEVYAALRLGMVEGDTVEQMVVRLRGRAVKPARWQTDPETGKRAYVPGQYEGGAMEATTREARVLAHTATMHISNQAREEFFAENEDMIKGYLHVATLDFGPNGEGTCIECAALDGHEYDAEEARPDLPLHPFCRCVYVPILKSWKELGAETEVKIPEGERASMDGQIPARTTFADYLAKKSEAQQNTILGPSRAALFRGGMPLSAMVESGKVIPLSELRAS